MELITLIEPDKIEAKNNDQNETRKDMKGSDRIIREDLIGSNMT